ncbi:MAG TPA: efflux RND transporter periplasmic adaptor subunit [Vicinamibacterales bacterium]
MRRAGTRTIVAVAGAIGVVFALLFVAGAITRARSARDLRQSAATVQTAVPQIAVIRPEPASDGDLTVAATTQGIRDTIVYARTTGYISKRSVDIGDEVKAGQLLAEIASPEVDQQLRQARADLNMAEKTLELQKATLDLARVTMGRYQAADAENAVAKEAVDQSVASARTAQAAVAAAEATVASNVANVSRLEELTAFEQVVAPFSGRVIQRNVDVGALITAGSPTNNTAVAPSSPNGTPNGLFEIARFDTLRVFVNVPQVYAGNIRSGLPVSVSVRGRVAQPVKGTVTRTASAVDPASRTLLTEVDIPNASHELLPGMFVYVAFSLRPAGSRWRVPATAVVIDAQGTRVVTVSGNNKLHLQPVVLGRDFGDSMDIQAGLHGDEAIVKQPTVSLHEGQLVRPTK